MSEQQTSASNNRPKCRDFAPSTFVGHWRDWHRGHGCHLDPTPVGEPTPPATPQQPVGLVCPFCGDDDFDAVGLKLHLTTYCEAYASVEVGNRVY